MLTKLDELISDATGRLILRETFIRKDNIILITDDAKMSQTINESMGITTAVSKVVIELSGLRRELFVLGSASEVKAKLNFLPGKTLLHG